MCTRQDVTLSEGPSPLWDHEVVGSNRTAPTRFSGPGRAASKHVQIVAEHHPPAVPAPHLAEDALVRHAAPDEQVREH